MNVRLATALLLTLMLFVDGCFMIAPRTIASIPSFTDPSYTGPGFGRFAVILETSDLEWHQAMESMMVNQLIYRNVQAVAGYTILSPTQQWSRQQTLDILAENHIDAFLSLTLDTLVVREFQVPERLTTKTTKERTRDEKDTLKYTEIESTTVTREGGNTQRIQSLRYSIRLLDRASGKVVWIAQQIISLDDYNGIDEFCNRTAEQLKQDAWLSPRDSARTH